MFYGSIESWILSLLFILCTLGNTYNKCTLIVIAFLYLRAKLYNLINTHRNSVVLEIIRNLKPSMYYDLVKTSIFPCNWLEIHLEIKKCYQVNSLPELRISVYTCQILCYNQFFYSGAWADQKATRMDNLVIPQRTGWITSYPPVVNGYVMQT